jgi:hypothetical protein
MDHVSVARKRIGDESSARLVLALFDKCLQRLGERSTRRSPALKFFRRMSENVEPGLFQRPTTAEELYEEVRRELGMRRVGDTWVFDNGAEVRPDLLERIEVRNDRILEGHL